MNIKLCLCRYNYCLQLCSDIKDNRVLVDRETSWRLTALMLQGTVDLAKFEHTFKEQSQTSKPLYGIWCTEFS